jgi:adenylate cyclase
VAEKRVTRKLAAIVAADVVGYSGLVEADEVGTIARLKSLRADVIDPRVAEYGGRVFHVAGDGLLIEFPSAVDAVESTLAIQQELKERSVDIAFRAGVNIGDVIAEGDDLLGDGVNIAARLEALAEPGGFALSGAARDQIQGKLELPLEDGGPQRLKNIGRPIHVWHWRPGIENRREQGAANALPLPGRPSIAVLPFDNLSGDPEQEYFADGITEDVITSLSNFRSLFVIARNSTFAFKGKAVDLKQVSRELGVRYLLEGSVRRAGDRVRLTAQLIDGESGHHLWAERYDRKLDDIFEVQDELTERVITTVVPALERAEQERSSRKVPGNMTTWDLIQRGRWHVNRLRLRDYRTARKLFRQAIERDARSPLGYIGVADIGVREATQALLSSDDDVVREGYEAARKAVELDDLDADAHCVLGWVHLIRREPDAALAEFEEAVRLNPNLARAHGGLGAALTYLDRIEAAGQAFATSTRLSPRDSDRDYWRMIQSAAAFLSGDLEQALAEIEMVLNRHPRWVVAITLRAAILAALGRSDEAQALEARVTEIWPDFALETVARTYPFKDHAFIENLRESLKAARWRLIA